MSVKTKRILATVLMAIPTIVLIIGGTMKVIGLEPETVVQFLTNSGFGDYLTLLGFTELVIAALIIFPKTNKIGFLLATGYFGGAFCLEISGSQPPASAAFLSILWVSMFLKDRQMFLV
jgi:hypothetical protein